MSIIEEALRRVQDPLLRPAKQPPAVAPQPQAAPQPPRPAPAHSWEAPPARSVPSPSPLPAQITPLTAVAVAVLALTVALVIGGAFWMGRAIAPGSQNAAPPPASPVTAQPRSAAPLVKVEPPARAERPRTAKESGAPLDLVLSGVVEGLGEPYAVINGLIVGIGERVADATLEEIANGSVTLRHDNGQKTILRVPR